MGALTRVISRSAGLLLALSVLSIAEARAQNATWNSTLTSGGSWGVGANWIGGTPASGVGNTATFGLDFNSGASVTLDGSRTIGTIATTSANPWSLDQGSGGISTINEFAINGAGNVTVTANLTGTNFTKNGNGTLIISIGSNSYSGSVAINDGTLSLVGFGNYATVATTVSIASGATLDVTGLTSGLRFGGNDTAFDVFNGDFISGNGTIKGGIRAGNGSIVYPGVSGVGTLHVNGGARFDAGSSWWVRPLTAIPGNSNVSNLLDVSGSMTLNNGMFMQVDGTGLTLTAGQTYDYTIATVTGSKSIGNVTFQPINFSPGSFNDPTMFSLLTSGSDLILRITPVPEPACLLAASAVVAVLSVRNWRRRAAG